MKSFTYDGYLRGELAGVIPDPINQHPTRPVPNVHGELKIDPEIVLKASPFPVQISFYYSSTATVNGELGPNRSASVRSYILNDEDESGIWAVRGDLNIFPLSLVSTSGSVSNYVTEEGWQGLTTLSYNSSGEEWIEYFPDGYQLLYKPQVTATPQKYCLVAVVHPSGVPHTYSYGSGVLAGLLTSIEEAAGRLVSFNYGPGPVCSLVNSIEDWTGRLWSFTHDANGNLTAFTTPIGCETQYTYLTVGPGPTTLISTIEDSSGFITGYGYALAYTSDYLVATMSVGAAMYSYTYGTSQQVVESPTGARTTYTLNSNGDVIAAAWPEGFTSSFTYDSNRLRTSEIRPSGVVMSNTYNSSGRVLVAQDPVGYLSTYQYDGIGNLTTFIDALGNVSVGVFDSSRNVVGTNDPYNNRTTSTYDGFGRQLTYQDQRGLITSYQYDIYGNLTTMTDSNNAVWVNAYDSLGRLISAQDPLLNITTYAYDAADHVVSVTDALSQTKQYIYQNCLLIASIDELGYRVSNSYGRFDNLITTENQLGFVWTSLWDSMGYQTGTQDPLNNLTTIVYNPAKQRIVDIDQLSYATSHTYDASGRPLATLNARGFITTGVWNARDLIATQNPLGNSWTLMYDAIGRVTTIQSPIGFTTATIYDKLGRIVATQDQMAYLISYTYDATGNRLTKQDANALVTTYTYASTFNKVVATTNAMGFVTSQGYDSMQHPIWAENSVGNKISFAYNADWMLDVTTNELGYATTTVYNEVNLVSNVLLANGQIRTYSYDGARNNLTIEYTGGSIVTMQYDPLNRLTTAIDWSGTWKFQYSPRSEMMTRDTDPDGFVQAYSYDGVGNRTVLIAPDDPPVSYSFDPLNRISVIESQTGLLYSHSYDADGRKTTLMLGLGTVRQFAYDPTGRLTTQIDWAGTAPINTLVDTYDPVGNRVVQMLNGVATTWSYDNNYRLLGQNTPDGVATFAYDSVNNPTIKWHQGSAPQTMTADAASRLLTSSLGNVITSYVYDNAGNMLSETTGNEITTYLYDSENRMTLIQFPTTGPTTMIYQGFDGLRRSIQPYRSEQTIYIWAGNDKIQERL